MIRKFPLERQFIYYVSLYQGNKSNFIGAAHQTFRIPGSEGVFAGILGGLVGEATTTGGDVYRSLRWVWEGSGVGVAPAVARDPSDSIRAKVVGLKNNGSTEFVLFRFDVENKAGGRKVPVVFERMIRPGSFSETFTLMTVGELLANDALIENSSGEYIVYVRVTSRANPVQRVRWDKDFDDGTILWPTYFADSFQVPTELLPAGETVAVQWDDSAAGAWIFSTTNWTVRFPLLLEI